MNTERTPYYHLGRLCDEWLETDVELDKKYPHGNLHEACRFYNLQHAIEDIYIIETGDEYPKLKKRYLIGDNPVQDWYQKVLDYALKHKIVIINKLLNDEQPEPKQLSLF